MSNLTSAIWRLGGEIRDEASGNPSRPFRTSTRLSWDASFLDEHFEAGTISGSRQPNMNLSSFLASSGGSIDFIGAPWGHGFYYMIELSRAKHGRCGSRWFCHLFSGIT